MNAVERAAEMLTDAIVRELHTAEVIAHFDVAVPTAQALADAGLLCSDADRDVLDAADRWYDAEWPQGLADANNELSAAVRVRRETQS